MNISERTKKEVNVYAINHIKHKNIVGYVYFKTLLEHFVELYHMYDKLPITSLKELHKLAQFDITYQSLQKSIFYFFQKEGYEKESIIGVLISMTEDIVSQNIPDFVEGDDY